MVEFFWQEVTPYLDAVYRIAYPGDLENLTSSLPSERRAN